jgi:hypothetical protein
MAAGQGGIHGVRFLKGVMEGLLEAERAGGFSLQGVCWRCASNPRDLTKICKLVGMAAEG